MNSRIEQALAEAPQPIANFLDPIIRSDQFDATLSATQFEELLNLSGLEDHQLRLALLPFAAAFAHVPLSQFYVGAVVKGLSGTLYFGANVEFSGVQIGQTIHAEQCAISHAWMKGEQGITDITINFSPCGHCRQFMSELATADVLNIQLPEGESKKLNYYLPESFGPHDLGIKSGFMANVDHGKETTEKDQLLKIAARALNKSYSPYTGSLSGVAIKTKNGKTYQGAYAENAAFNPSLPPLQVSIIQLLMDAQKLENIESVALIETKNGHVSQLASTQAMLEAIDPDIQLIYQEI